VPVWPTRSVRVWLPWGRRPRGWCATPSPPARSRTATPPITRSASATSPSCERRLRPSGATLVTPEVSSRSPPSSGASLSSPGAWDSLDAGDRRAPPRRRSWRSRRSRAHAMRHSSPSHWRSPTPTRPWTFASWPHSTCWAPSCSQPFPRCGFRGVRGWPARPGRPWLHSVWPTSAARPPRRSTWVLERASAIPTGNAQRRWTSPAGSTRVCGSTRTAPRSWRSSRVVRYGTCRHRRRARL
jgi:hypothetical protein